MERGGWNGPRKHGEGGNTTTGERERESKREESRESDREEWRLCGWKCESCMCCRVCVERTRDQSRRVSSIDENGRIEERAHLGVK